jgi:NADH:ubiquinone oxidoreductase subunit E
MLPAQHYRQPDAGAVLTTLHEINTRCGYLPAAEIRRAALDLGVPLSALYSAATFYTLFYTKPQGRHVVRICDSPPCHIEGSEAIGDAISKYLGVKPGETTSDGAYTFETVSCMGLCGVAPAMMVNDDVYGNLTSDRVPDILDKYREGE